MYNFIFYCILLLSFKRNIKSLDRKYNGSDSIIINDYFILINGTKEKIKLQRERFLKRILRGIFCFRNTFLLSAGG